VPVRVRIGLLIALVCLLLGAATTYVSAWVLMNLPAAREGLEAYGSVGTTGKTGASRAAFGVECMATSAEYDTERGLLVTPQAWPGLLGKSPSWSLADRTMLPSGPVGWSGTLLERAAGWPMPAVVERMFRGQGGVPVACRGHDWTMRRANHVNPWMRRTLAFMPVWPGFAVNTGVFWIAWLVVIGGPVVRRWRRAAAGECAKCRYDLRGISAGVCPECGAGIVLASSGKREDTVLESVSSGPTGQ
jgi:hypothetical protein